MTTEKIVTSAATDAHAFACDELTARYGRIVACRGVSLGVRPKEVVAILGPNGAGKTSLAGALAGRVRMSGGVALGDVDVASMPAHARAKAGIALVPDNRGIFGGMTVSENLMLGARLGKRHQRTADLERVMDIFPILRSRLTQLAGTMSGGEQQMLALAKVIARRPRVLILDEPTQGLSVQVVRMLAETLKELCRDIEATIVVEQNQEFASEIADRYLVMSAGSIVQGGSKAEMRDKQRILDAYISR